MADDGVGRRVLVFRVLAVLTVGLGLAYLTWRYTSTVNLDAAWFAIPLIAAETYGFLSTLLFVFGLWKPARRVPPPPLEGVTVDVFITTYNEPVELVRLTLEAALRIDWPLLKVHVLDDGARPQMQELATSLGSGYITRGEEWNGKPRHAKAGNVNNALLRTDGEYILILDADQIPDPRIVRRIMGYFRDPALAFVQTPQHFYNLPPGDPFGSDAPMFYGPVMQGKDGWNAAFFCGSNAILRREALLQLGLTGYVREMQERFDVALRTLRRDLWFRGPPMDQATRSALRSALEAARQALRKGVPLQRVSEMVRAGLTAARDASSDQDILQIADTLQELAEADDVNAAEVRRHLLEQVGRLPEEVKRDARSLGLNESAVADLNLTRAAEAQPVLPLATISVTEDMATAMQLHALGWKSVFHPEVLAFGLAPEDLRSALSQRLRWAQGTLQVLLRDNPLFKRGLTFPQRLQYFATMFAYFDGFANLVFILSPIICLVADLTPIRVPWPELLLRLGPYLLVGRAMNYYVTRGLGAWRSEQYSLALFPLWIRAVVGTLLNRRLPFVVTPKQRQSGNFLGLVRPQIAVIVITALAIGYGGWGLATGTRGTLASVATNAFWGVYDITMLLPIVRAAVFRPPAGWAPAPPAFLVSGLSADQAGRESMSWTSSSR
jgi:cellulose synthase (UDP-forming)